jgi:hypothetical protein
MSYQSDVGLIATLINGRQDAHQALVRITAQHEALMKALWALDQCVDDFGETGKCVCQSAKEQAIDALEACRSAGIMED